MAILTGDSISPFVLFGTVIGMCAPICFRNLNYCFRHRSKCDWIRALKSAMALFMLVKSCLIVALNAPNGTSCVVTGKFADIFYQFSTTIGDAVVLERMQAVVSSDWKRMARLGHSLAVLLRLIVGMVDIHYASIPLDTLSDSCVYEDEPILGVLYSGIDSAISLYAICVTCFVLIQHMRKLQQDGSVQLSWHQYIFTVVRYTSTISLLTVVNVVGTIANGTRINNHSYTPLVDILWPITNLLFVSLIGYDVDVSKTISNMHTQLQVKQPNLFDQALSPYDDPSYGQSPDTMT